MNLNKHKEAIADFSMVIQGTKATNAQKAQAYRNRAKSKTAIGDLKGAEEDLTAYSQHAK